MIPKPTLRMVNLGQPFVPARCSRNGVSTRVVPTMDSPAAIQSMRQAAGVNGFDENSERSRIQIIGNARKNGAPARKCHQFPWLPGTRSVTASHGDVLKANGRKATAAAASQRISAAESIHVEPDRTSMRGT